MESSSTTKLVPAKCTSCGANLEVDASQETAICSFCNASYIVEKAISLLFTDKKGKKTVYELRWLKKHQLISGGFSFTYGETPSGISFICKDKGPEWIKVISNVLSGIYPAMYNPQSNGIDNYIRNNFNTKTKVLAIKYYRDMTGASFTEAKSKVDEIL